MIPEFIIVKGSNWKLLPPGIHEASMDEVFRKFATNERRKSLFKGLKKGLDNIFNSGCPQIFLDGSYVTEKPYPNDYEVCWDTTFVNPLLLDPVFFDLANGRENQKLKYYGEYFPAMLIEGMSGKPFVDFFQIDKESGNKKGIILVLNYLKKEA
ncbi:MAG: hypothetical protein WCO37_11920 [Bacteroidota bacterium]